MVYPVVIIEIEEVKCRALLDTGAGSSYASATLIDILNRKPDCTEKKRIEMMMVTTSQKIDLYNLQISGCQGKLQAVYYPE